MGNVLISFIWAILAFAPLCWSVALPVVDLGYELHQALSYNATTDVYKFLNIRYARSPVGDLRFRAPVAPLSNRSVIQNGSVTRTCPQGVPAWQAKAFGPITEYIKGKPFTLAGWEASVAAATAPVFNFNAATTEDCLFLDVHVSRKAFQNATQSTTNGTGAPVLVWIHGGGYAFGSKLNTPVPTYNPDGLFQQAAKLDLNGMVFVSLNYRLGAFGFLSGPEVSKDGDINVGLLDQRHALDWVKNNIHIFGGSPNRVTVMGESAGGGSILLQTAAYGGRNGSVPFAQAILQSPAIVPPIQATDEAAFNDFLALLKVSTIGEARALSSEEVILANARQVSASNQTSYTYGPVVDGIFSPEQASQLFQRGSFDQNVKFFTAHNYFEGSFFFDPNVTTDEEFQLWVGYSMPGLSTSSVNYVANTLYPHQFDGSLGYVDHQSRQMSVWAEAVMNCNWLLINQVLNGSSFAYEFSVTPGIHAEDQKYTFNDFTTPPLFPPAQATLQYAITSFVFSGLPILNSQQINGTWPMWGPDRTVVNVTANGPELSKNSINETRCAWWNQGRFVS